MKTFSPLVSLSICGETYDSHSYFMRSAKLLIVLEGYVCFLSVSFRQFPRVNPVESTK